MDFSPLVDCISNVNLKVSNLYNNRNTKTLSRRLTHYLSDNGTIKARISQLCIQSYYNSTIIRHILADNKKYINC